MLRHMRGDSAGHRPAGLTGVRQEIKYLLRPAKGREVMKTIGSRIPSKIVDGSPFSYRISVYLDVPDFEMARAGLKNGSQTTKLRIKEYYLAENGVPVFGGGCWFEVKARTGTMVEKSRFPVKREQIVALLDHGPADHEDPARQAAIDAFESVRDERPLKPLVVVHYCRWTFQDKESNIRVTFDNGATYHLPPEDLYTPGHPLAARIYLPPPLVVENRWIMEVKSLGPAPLWIEEATGKVSPVEYSKFGTGIRAVADLGIIPRENP